MANATNSTSIRKWAGELELIEIFRVGETIGWERADGERVIETNGDPVWPHEEGCVELWERRGNARQASIRVDHENNAEAWWDAARDLANSVRNPDFTRVFNLLDGSDEIEVSQNDAEHFLETATKLTGWDDGPNHARNPVIVSW